jgi:epoxyqueuosine reductase
MVNLAGEHIARNTQTVKKIARELGFDHCGISKAGFMDEEARQLEAWLNRNHHGEMQYMANHFDKRVDPTRLVEGARSVVSLLLNYYPPVRQEDPDAPKISKYAYGTDYHSVIKDKLHTFLECIREEIGEVGGRVFVDSAPVLDKAWAKRSGLGWIGKHTNLLNREMGSFFFIAELIIDLELEADGPVKDHCGTCTRCIDACPTDAIVAPYIVDGSKCISYFTIELKKEIPAEVKGKFENWAFGCDICQDVCPWNRFSKPNTTQEFSILPEIQQYGKSEWQEMTEEVFATVFKNSPLKRTKWEGLKRNLLFLEGE